MTIGIRVRDRTTGAIIFDPSTPAVRLLGSYTIPGSTNTSNSGTIQVPDFATGTPWLSLYQGGYPSNTQIVHMAQAMISGTTLTWYSGPLDAKLLYGVYAGGTASGKAGSGQIGVRFINGNQVTLIDSIYSNQAFISKQAVSIPSNGQTTITYTGGHPLVAYRGTGTIAVGAATVSGNTWTLSLQGGYGQTNTGTIYIFDSVVNAPIISNTNIGMRIRNRATGQVTFDSRCRYAKIYRVATNPAAGRVPASPVTEQLSMDGLACVANMPGVWWNPNDASVSSTSSDPTGGGGGGVVTSYAAYMCGGGVNGTTLTTQSIALGINSSDAIVPGDSDTQYMLVDVSGL